MPAPLGGSLKQQNGRRNPIYQEYEIIDLDVFVKNCKSAITNEDPTPKIEALVRDAIADPKGLHSAFSARITGKSLRDRIVYNDDELTVLQVATVPGLQSPVHNHNMWAVIGVYDGEERDAFYEQTADGLKQSGELHLKEGISQC